MGVVLMILGFASHLGQESGQLAERMELTKLTVGLLVLGGYGFLLMLFYCGGVHSLPCYPSAPQEVAHGASQARLALVFISALLVGVVLSLWDTGRRYWSPFRFLPQRDLEDLGRIAFAGTDLTGRFGAQSIH